MIFLYIFIASTLMGLSEVIRYHLEPKAVSPLQKKRLNVMWHIYRDLAIISYMAVAWQLPTNDLILLAIHIPALYAIHWVMSDGVQNIMKGLSFFGRSKTSGNYVEKFGTWYVKIALLLVGIGIKYYSDYKKKIDGKNLADAIRKCESNEEVEKILNKHYSK